MKLTYREKEAFLHDKVAGAIGEDPRGLTLWVRAADRELAAFLGMERAALKWLLIMLLVFLLAVIL